MFSFEYPETPWVIALFAVSVACSGYFLARRRHVFDPRVFFPVVYGFALYGPCLHSLWFDEPYHHGVKIDLLPQMLGSGCTAIFGFCIGASLAMGRFGRTPVSQTNGSGFVVLPTRHRDTAATVRRLSAAVAVLAIFAYAYFTFQLIASQPNGGGESKSAFFDNASEGVLRGLHFSTSLCSVMLVTYIIADSACSRRLLSFETLLTLPLYSLVCMVGGERDFVLVGLIWMAANWSRIAVKFRVALVTAAFAVIIIIPIIRAQGLGAGNISDGLARMDLAAATKSLFRIAPNATVYTSTIAMVPSGEPHWHGRSVVNAVRSFVPGQPESVHFTPMRWFADNYEKQGRSGFAFCQDAEAYLNFGFYGVPVWFGCWGLFMGTMYRRAHTYGASLVTIFVWWQSATAFMFAIRADIRTPLKIIVYGCIAVKAMSVTAELLNAYRRSTTLRTA